MSDPPFCYKFAANDACDHPGWYHPADWTVVGVALAAGSRVVDEDGITITGVTTERGPEQGERWVEEREARYAFCLQQILIEGNSEPPVTEQDEQDTLASIADAFRNLDH